MSVHIENQEDRSPHDDENSKQSLKDQPISFKDFVSAHHLRRSIEYTLSEGIALFDLHDLDSIGIVKTSNFSKILRYQVRNQKKCKQWIKKLQIAIQTQKWQPSRPMFFDEPKSTQISTPRPLCSLKFEDHVVYYLLVNYLIRLDKKPFYTIGLNDHLNSASMFRKTGNHFIKQYYVYNGNQRECKNRFATQRRFLKDYQSFWMRFKRSTSLTIENLKIENENKNTPAHNQSTKKTSPPHPVLMRNNRLLKTNLQNTLYEKLFIQHQINQEPNHFDLLMCQTDIMQFFDHIRHDVLLAKIKSYYPQIEDYPYQLLAKCLNQWSGNTFFGNQNIGIPQNVYPSKILANLYIKAFDEAITHLNPENQRGRNQYDISKIYYDRYVDDMKFYVYDRKKYPHIEDFQRIIQNTIQSELQKIGLSINASKTKFLDQQIDHQNPIIDWRLKSFENQNQKEKANQIQFEEMHDLEKVFNFDFYINTYRNWDRDRYVPDKLLKAILNLTELLGFEHFFKNHEYLPAYLFSYLDQISKNPDKNSILSQSKKLHKSNVSLKNIDWFYRICLNQLRMNVDPNEEFYALKDKQIPIIKKSALFFLDKHDQYLEYYLQFPLKLQDYLDLLVFYENYHYYPYLRFLFYEKLTWSHHQKNLRYLPFFSLKILITEIKKIESKYPSDCSAYAFKLCDILNQIELAKTEKFDFDWSSIV